MNAYAIYRIMETIRIMIFMVAAMLAFNTYPITAIMIILLALLNDLPIMAIAVDNTWLDPLPVRWEMHRVLTLATLLGLIGVAETFLLLIIVKSWLVLPMAVIQTVIFLKLSIAGHLTLFVARTKRPMLTRPFPAPVLLGAILGTQVIAAMIAGFGILITPIPRVVHRPDLGLLSDLGIHRGPVQTRGIPALAQGFSAPSELSRDTRRQSAYPRPLKPDFRVTGYECLPCR
jgi:H+-transporting ATPase